MNTFVRDRVAVVAIVLAATLPASRVLAQPATPEDWPCIQVLIPEIELAVYWPRVLQEADEAARRNDSAAMALGDRFADTEQISEPLLEAVDALLAETDEADQARRLDTIADQTVSRVNERRARYLDGIRRFTQQQIAIASQIENTLNQIAALDETEADDPALDRDEIERTLVWHERLYDQRERSIRALCEQPVALEEHLASVIRELSYRLPAL